MKPETGGPAFPCPEDERHTRADGMSLRDYFAAQVVTAMGHLMPFGDLDRDVIPDPATEIARTAYEVADAMLAARAK